MNHRKPLMAAAIFAVAGCSNSTPPPSNYIMEFSYSQQDFTSDVVDRDRGYAHRDTQAVVAFRWAGAVDDVTLADADEYFPEHIRVVQIATGTVIPGEIRAGLVRLDGEFSAWGDTYAFSFVPTAPLPDGWYIMATDLGPWLSDHRRTIRPTSGWFQYVEGDVMYLRFSVGRSQTWIGTAANNREDDGSASGPGCFIAPVLADPPSPLGPNPFSLLVDGAPDGRCVELSGAEYGWGWRCPVYGAETVLTISLDDRSAVAPIADLTVQRIEMDDVIAANIYGSYRPLLDERFGVDRARGLP